MIVQAHIITKDGLKRKKFFNAGNEKELLRMLHLEESYLISYKKTTRMNKRRFDLKLASIFCYQVSTVLAAGVDLPSALNLIQGKTVKEKERRIYRDLLESVQKGNSLSSAMVAQVGVFDDFLISMLISGELSGDLQGSLKTMAHHYEKTKKIKDRIQTAALYPIILSIITAVIVLVLLVFVLPTITQGFEFSELPMTTKLLYGLSRFIIKFWWLLGLLILGGLYFGKQTYDRPSVKIRLHKNILYLPILGNLLRIIYSARLARSFSSLYTQGVSIPTMIELSSHNLNNAYFQSRLIEMNISVSHGSSISRALEEIKEFDPMLASMMSIGEETGALDDVLIKIADYFDDEANTAITKIIGLIEPVMILSMGIIIALIVLSIMQPLFKMYDTI